jgi:hypothetical protein
MDRAAHLSTDDLILFMDREMELGSRVAAETHLLNCAECGKRLAALQDGSAAYGQYHEHVLKPALGIPERGWAQGQKKPSRRNYWWAAAAALAASLAVTVIYVQRATEPSTPELLAKAEAVADSNPHALLFTTGSTKLTRPAELQHVQALFVQANYSWEKPLSARSFAAWRRQLPQKKDLVTSGREDSGQQYYRVRTQTPAGILRTASITLQAGSYRATRAVFEFQDESPLEVSEQADETPPIPRTKAPSPKVTETVASPEDELRVFAALNAIGADAGDPVEVKLDAGRHHVLVTGMGMPSARQKELETALAGLPGTVLRFNSAPPANSDSNLNPAPATYSADSGSAFRQQLQTHVGGARELQAITDGALDASNTLLAEAHALDVLAREFPAPVEITLSSSGRRTLSRLRAQHLTAIQEEVRQLKENLKPLLGTSDAGADGTADLFTAARNLDRLVSRLLAGSYTDQMGGELLNQLPGSLSKVEMLAQSQALHNR